MPDALISTDDCVKKSTTYIAVAISLLIGFLGGVIFSSIQSSGTNPAVTAAQPAAPASPALSSQQANKIMALSQRVSKNPLDVDAWTELGNIFFDTNQSAQAITAYEKSLKLRPSDSNVLTDLGVMYRRSGQPDKAIKAFERASSIDPANTHARFNKGIVLLYDKGDALGAIKAWEDLLKLNPGARATDGRPVADFIAEAKAKVDGKK
ncbi:MAG: tetratricopeptide repeat protein [Deltaproteobacteria bacterium]|nr:tetratricopeptide repeat protein [Deltaproteobacteria bacterium]